MDSLINMENRFHFGLKVAVISHTTDLVRKFIESIPGVKLDPEEDFRFLKVYSFPLFISNSIILRIDLWALPDNVRQRGDAELLCCDASVVFYVAATESDLLTLLSIFHRDIRASNPQCKYICCGELNENSLTELGKASGFLIQKTENMEKKNIESVFFSTIASVINQIPNPPDPAYLLYTNIRLGSLLLNDPNYQKALRPITK